MLSDKRVHSPIIELLAFFLGHLNLESPQHQVFESPSEVLALVETFLHHLGAIEAGKIKSVQLHELEVELGIVCHHDLVGQVVPQLLSRLFRHRIVRKEDIDVSVRDLYRPKHTVPIAETISLSINPEMCEISEKSDCFLYSLISINKIFLHLSPGCSHPFSL